MDVPVEPLLSVATSRRLLILQRTTGNLSRMAPMMGRVQAAKDRDRHMTIGNRGPNHALKRASLLGIRDEKDLPWWSYCMHRPWRMYSLGQVAIPVNTNEVSGRISSFDNPRCKGESEGWCNESLA